MVKKSAGLLVYKVESDELRVFLVHPGGPFFRNKDKGVWSIPKGEIGLDENPFDAARREFRDETGQDVDGEFVALPECRYVNGKIILAWEVEAGTDAAAIKSNSFEMEWPPRSRQKQSFPEVDRGAWFSLAEAREKINKGQVALIDAIERIAKG